MQFVEVFQKNYSDYCLNGIFRIYLSFLFKATVSENFILEWPRNTLKNHLPKTHNQIIMNEVSEANKIATKLHEILEIRNLNESTFIIKLEKNGLSFKSGQHINAGPANSIHTREYSIYNGENDDFLEIMVKEVSDGFISPVLKKQLPGNMLVVEEPVGYFSLPRKENPGEKLLFIASGTGISPFHSFIQTHPKLDYTLLHGIRDNRERYEADFYESPRYIACTSRQKSDNSYFGRVTTWLEEHPVPPNTRCYLCGNSSMIHDAYDILEAQGVPSEMIHAEVYF
jgi:ferredoxin--NADP+ reductase